MACLELLFRMVGATRNAPAAASSNAAESSRVHVLLQNLNLAYPKWQRLHSEDDIHWKLDC
jgi:hypothetical protein